MQVCGKFGADYTEEPSVFAAAAESDPGAFQGAVGRKRPVRDKVKEFTI